MDTEFQVMFDGLFSEEAQSKYLAEFAIESRKTVEQQNAGATGMPVGYATFVDGVEGAAESSVKANGTIVYVFQSASDLIQFIRSQLEMNSPAGSGHDKHTGLYKASHKLLADGIEVPGGDNIPSARIYLFVNMLPYAGKIEKGESSQAPHGVYEVTAFQATAKFGNSAKITFIDYPGPSGVFPAIEVTM